MTEDQIKHMVNRFLCWHFPENFNPDGGISFRKGRNEYMPSGTNLLDATQADAMVREMIDGMPLPKRGIVPDRECFWLVERNTVPPQYVSHNSAGWHDDVWQARRFDTEREAHDYWRMMGETDRRQFKAIEHMFINRED